MKGFLAWVIRNTPAMNTLMVATLLVGAFSLLSMRREVFPEFEMEIILVTVPYPGASPSEVEEGICQKIEEGVRAIDGIKKVTAVAAEGTGTVMLELEQGVRDVQKVLGEVRSEVDRIPSFPELAEDPEIKQITIRRPAIRVGVLGPDADDPRAEWQLRELAEKVRDDIIALPGISQAELMAARPYQIDVEVPEETLRRHGLTLRQIAAILRRENLELPGGLIRTDAEEVLVKGKNKHLVGAEIARLPILSRPDGAVLTVADLGSVSDAFDDTTSQTWVNGRPAQVVEVTRTADEDVLVIADAVRKYVAEAQLPPGYQLRVWGDESIDVRDRLELLTKNGVVGLVLVFLTLAVFLELRLAFWVAMGVPFSILGACVLLIFLGQTLNMLSTFGFLMALGILVDDAIVIGENIYAHRQQGKGFLRAAIEGTAEVVPSVAASVGTTVVAFLPLMFVTGVMGKFIAVLPIAVIAMLLISLLESTFILPCHLAHGHAEGEEKATLVARARRRSRRLPLPLRLTFGMVLVGGAALLSFLAGPFRLAAALLGWTREHAQRWLEGFVNRVYLPQLRWALKNPASIVAGAVGILLLAVGCVRSGLTPFVIFPRIDSKSLTASITYPDGTPKGVTRAALERVEQAAREVNEHYEKETGRQVIWLYRRSLGHAENESAPGQVSSQSGSNVGSVRIELVEPAERTVTSNEIMARWRETAGEFPGVETLRFAPERGGPAGKPIEFKLLARAEHVEQLEAAVQDIIGSASGQGAAPGILQQYAGVHDIGDDSRPGKWEFQLRVKPGARAMGVPLEEVAETVRASYYGAEVMRLQRGRHEVKFMVRYPEEDRRSLADFSQIRVRMEDGAERPLTEVAEVSVRRGYSEINRVNQLRSITISADVDESRANAREIVADLQRRYIPNVLARHPGVSVRWEGQQEQTTESVQSLMVGLVVALIGMFLLLTFEFESYGLPLLIMAVIPFGIVGAIGGHILMDMPITLFSLFGIVALTGVVVNDSIVLIDFINSRVRAGTPLEEALIDAGRRRFRPVMLTSVTTIAGLLPMLLETSLQAQILIPMATSLSFGLMLATVLVLLLVPVFYLLYSRAFGVQTATEEAPAQSEELPTLPHAAGPYSVSGEPGV